MSCCYMEGLYTIPLPGVCVCLYLEQEVHETAMGLHLVFQLVEDDEGG